ncbi:MAG: preprotein translocase subunit SecG [Gammaproteobacteria bacterium]
MYTILSIVLVIVAVALVSLVLIQQGKGADIGAAFGSGASQTVFGSRGSASFMTRATAVLAALFFILCLSLAYLSGNRTERKSVTDMAVPVQPKPAQPVGVTPMVPAMAPSGGTQQSPVVPAKPTQ